MQSGLWSGLYGQANGPSHTIMIGDVERCDTVPRGLTPRRTATVAVAAPELQKRATPLTCSGVDACCMSAPKDAHTAGA